MQRFFRDVGRAVSEATSLDEVFNAGRRVGLDVVVAGRVLKTESVAPDQGAALLQLYAYDCRSGAWLVRDTFEGDWKPNVAEKVAARVLGLSPRGRFLVWLVVVLALPWATFWGTAWALRRASNAASFVLILVYTMVGLLLAVALSGFRVTEPGAWWRFFAAMAFCALYNYWACERIAARQR